MVSGELITIAPSVYLDYDINWFVEETPDEDGGMRSLSLDKELSNEKIRHLITGEWVGLDLFWRNAFPPACAEDKPAKARQKMAANFMINRVEDYLDAGIARWRAG
jgi:hypothetical protein